MRFLGENRGTILFVDGGTTLYPKAHLTGTSVAFAGQAAYAQLLNEFLGAEGIQVSQLIIGGRDRARPRGEGPGRPGRGPVGPPRQARPLPRRGGDRALRHGLSPHNAPVASWSEFEAAAPELAARVRERLDAHVHKTLATLRSDGSPRISGTETQWRDDDLWIGSMAKAVKARDLQRDPRFALHSGSDDPDVWSGDAKLAGVAEETTEPGDSSHTFRLDLREVSTVALDEARKHLVIEVWTPEKGVRSFRRE